MYIDEFNDDRIVPFVERNTEKMKNLDILDVISPLTLGPLYLPHRRRSQAAHQCGSLASL